MITHVQVISSDCLAASFFVLLLIGLGCSAQSAPPDVARLVERQIRSHYPAGSEVKISVGPLRPSEFPNYDKLTVTIGNNAGKKEDLEFLLSKDNKTMVRWTPLDLTKDPFAEIMKKIAVLGRPTRGNKDAKVVAVNYDDFECPFCASMHQTLFPAIFKEYGDRVLFIYKDYPLEEIHPWAVHAAVDANCLAAQNNDAYWDFADYLHANQRAISNEKGREAQNTALDKLTTLQGEKHNLDGAKLQSCVKAQDNAAVRASTHEADDLGVSATPTLFVNGQKLDGAVPIDEVRAALDRALQDAGVAPPAHKAAGEAHAPPVKPSK
jgi:protein-disulfide isomerase